MALGPELGYSASPEASRTCDVGIPSDKTERTVDYSFTYRLQDSKPVSLGCRWYAVGACAELQPRVLRCPEPGRHPAEDWMQDRALF